jgi:hypothetical protein
VQQKSISDPASTNDNRELNLISESNKSKLQKLLKRTKFHFSKQQEQVKKAKVIEEQGEHGASGDGETPSNTDDSDFFLTIHSTPGPARAAVWPSSAGFARRAALPWIHMAELYTRIYTSLVILVS